VRFLGTGWRRLKRCLLSCRSFSTKEPQIIGLFCGKWYQRVDTTVSIEFSQNAPHRQGERFLGTGCRRLIGSLKLQVILAKEPLIIGLFCGKWYQRVDTTVSIEIFQNAPHRQGEIPRYRVSKTHRMPEVAGPFRKRATNYRALLREMVSAR